LDVFYIKECRHCEASFSLAKAIFLERLAVDKKIASSAEKPPRNYDNGI